MTTDRLTKDQAERLEELALEVYRYGDEHRHAAATVQRLQRELEAATNRVQATYEASSAKRAELDRFIDSLNGGVTE